MLYFRMLLSMLLTLYTSRVILKALGIDDYGIYNVVGGICTMFTFLNGTLSSSTSRFLIFEIGRKNKKRLKRVFSTSLFNHLIIAGVIGLLCETIGVWLLENKLVISPERMVASRVAFQFSVLSCLLVILNSPFNAAIICHERMTFFAYISIIEVALRLVIVYVLYVSPWDTLSFYAILLFGVQLVMNLCYYLYCEKNFSEVKFSIQRDKNIQKEMLSFAGWGLFGHLSAIMNNQVFDILLNIFFGPAVNAARGIAMQSQNAITRFGSNFQMALNPQIIKSYASGDLAYMRNLMFKSINYTFYLLFILSLPVYLEIDYILKLWLGDYPEKSNIFLRFMLFCSIIESLANPFPRAAEASGHIKKYQVVVGSLILLNIPTSYALLKCGLPVESAFYSMAFYSVVSFIARYIMVKDIVGLNIKMFADNVLYKIAIIIPIAISFPLLVHYEMEQSFARLTAVSAASLLSCSLCYWIIGLSYNEKKFVKSKVKSMLKSNGRNRR